MPTEDYYYCDNFFKKMTDLESPKKTNDCYFYYYSTCSKGDSCGFRHEPSALGCETMCAFWKEGKCLNVHCNFRHMELRKNRKAIPCYWETQPGGCLKPHCPFMHQKSRGINQRDEKDITENTLPENCNQANNYKGTLSGTPVDSLVVNFEEESDSENTPIKVANKVGESPEVKTLDEIKLEKITAACAAFYSYPDQAMDFSEETSSDDLRHKIMQKTRKRQTASIKRKLTPEELAHILGGETSDRNSIAHARSKLGFDESKTTEFKVKSLAEIRAEKRPEDPKTNIKSDERKRKHSPIRLSRNKIAKLDNPLKIKETIDETEVTSTSPDVPVLEKQLQRPLRKLNLSKLKVPTDDMQTSTETETTNKNFESVKIEIKRTNSSKSLEEDLLSDDNDDDDVNFKAEDDLLNEIDNLLND
ncbi:uncharacterized protein LOC143194449 isoform X1 [Rhynchophorus ferrugineus]|uniref:uncharacterized protein LOC143194449 isoform X1 n=2 Tax=Rhynchophorus ferrugineus TaxID=354439 RepID=UPI003FCD199C